jgi:hypothetical protein
MECREFVWGFVPYEKPVGVWRTRFVHGRFVSTYGSARCQPLLLERFNKAPRVEVTLLVVVPRRESSAVQILHPCLTCVQCQIPQGRFRDYYNMKLSVEGRSLQLPANTLEPTLEQRRWHSDSHGCRRGQEGACRRWGRSFPCTYWRVQSVKSVNVCIYAPLEISLGVAETVEGHGVRDVHSHTPCGVCKSVGISTTRLD